jgi:aminoglycoside phosphotransferase (APT) family kinase protein
VRVVFEDESDLEMLERAARALAELARIDAEGARGNTIEKIHRESQARYLRFADRIRAVRSRLDPEVPPDNVRKIRRE